MRKHNLIRPNKDKLSKPRKVNIGFHPGFMQRISLQQLRQWSRNHKTGPYTCPASEAPAALSLKSPKHCVICTPTGRLCPNEYSKADWPDNPEDEKESQEQNKDKDNFSDIDDWVADLEQQKKKDNKTPTKA